MKIKASKPVQVTTKVNFPVGKRLTIQTEKIKLKIKETDDNQLQIDFDKAYKTEKFNRHKSLIIFPEVIRKKNVPLTEGMVPDIKEYINWSAVGRLLVGNASTIRKGYIPKKQQDRINELLKVVNDWVVKQMQEI